MDGIRERAIQDQFDSLTELNDKQLQTVQTLVRILSQFEARLSWYEKHIPRMRELKRQFEQEQRKLQQLVPESSEEKRRLSDGIVGVIRE